MPPPDIPLPTRLLLAHAGSPEVNGEYHWAGSVNGRPFWQRSDSETCVWYFKSPSVLTMTFDGWYVSRRPHTSWSSASEDYYCAYDSDHPATNKLPLPPFSSTWTVRDSSGFLSRLTGGCGAAPPPSFSFAADDLQSTRHLLQPHVPPAVRVFGCGLGDLNGIYVYSHEVNDRPCWLLQQHPHHDSPPPSPCLPRVAVQAPPARATCTVVLLLPLPPVLRLERLVHFPLPQHLLLLCRERLLFVILGCAPASRDR